MNSVKVINLTIELQKVAHTQLLILPAVVLQLWVPSRTARWEQQWIRQRVIQLVGITDGPNNAIPQAQFDVPLPTFTLNYGTHFETGQLICGTPRQADVYISNVINVDIVQSILVHDGQSIVPQHHLVQLVQNERTQSWHYFLSPMSRVFSV